jgi:hypothetical protein
VGSMEHFGSKLKEALAQTGIHPFIRISSGVSPGDAVVSLERNLNARHTRA